MQFDSDCANCFAGLACQTRMEIINLLQTKKKMSVLEIARHFKVSQPTITYHLQYLKQVGILDFQKKGTKVYYFISPKCGVDECQIFSPGF